jgi:bifunctional non-homologous end joining protein LigD
MSNVRPSFYPPTIPSAVEEPPGREPWIHEIKHDGYRTIVGIDGGTVQAFAKTGLDWSKR